MTLKKPELVTISTRKARTDDAQAMCDLLNPIITEGTTTAHRSLFDTRRMITEYIQPKNQIRTTVAEENGVLLGFQLLKWSNPDYAGSKRLPADWAIIASFVKIGEQGRQIGQTLWLDTLKAAKESGVTAIDATIRTDNIPGLAYYGGLGFVDYAHIKDIKLSDGSRISKVRRKFVLTAD